MVIVKMSDNGDFILDVYEKEAKISKTTVTLSYDDFMAWGDLYQRKGE